MTLRNKKCPKCGLELFKIKHSTFNRNYPCGSKHCFYGMERFIQSRACELICKQQTQITVLQTKIDCIDKDKNKVSGLKSLWAMIKQ